MPEDDDERWGGRAWTLLAAVGIVLAVAAVGAWLIFGGDDGNDTAGEDGAAAPAEYIGPRAIEGGVPVGFSHSPEGSQAAAAAWASYGGLSPISRVPDGVNEVFDPPELLGTPDPEDDTWFSTTPVAVSSGIDGNAGVVRVLVIKTQLLEDDANVAVSLLSLALALEWAEDEDDWRVTQIELVDEFVPPVLTDDLAGFEWLGPISYQTFGPLFSR